MIATAEDVMDGFARLWSEAGLPPDVPGGLHGHGLPAGTRLPFALIRVAPDQRRTYAHRSGSFLEPFVVTVWLHVSEPEGRRRALTRLLSALDGAQRFWPVLAGRCVHVRPLAPPGDPSPVQDTLARDVAVVASAWEVLMQQSQSPVGV